MSLRRLNGNLAQSYSLRDSNFENGELAVAFYERHHDCRARLLCKTKQKHKIPKVSVKALTSLVVQRSGSFLKFKYRSGPKRDDYWAALRFRTYEGISLSPIFFK